MGQTFFSLVFRPHFAGYSLLSFCSMSLKRKRVEEDDAPFQKRIKLALKRERFEEAQDPNPRQMKRACTSYFGTNCLLFFFNPQELNWNRSLHTV